MEDKEGRVEVQMGVPVDVHNPNNHGTWQDAGVEKRVLCDWHSEKMVASSPPALCHLACLSSSAGGQQKPPISPIL